jgi:hypothetical protein
VTVDLVARRSGVTGRVGKEPAFSDGTLSRRGSLRGWRNSSPSRCCSWVIEITVLAEARGALAAPYLCPAFDRRGLQCSWCSSTAAVRWRCVSERPATDIGSEGSQCAQDWVVGIGEDCSPAWWYSEPVGVERRR